MLTIRKAFVYFLFTSVSIFVSGFVSTAAAQSDWPNFNPCETDHLSVGEGSWIDHQAMIVYDPNQGACWLANANLAADPDVVAKLGITDINPNGSMDYATAVKWVAAMNAYNNGAGWLGHNKWQIPVAPLQDLSCGDVGTHGGSFGPGCTDSAMGNLYKVGLRMMFPNSVARPFGAQIWPIYNLKLSYYWALQNNGGTSGTNNGGQEMFAFGNGQQGGTTINDTYYYVLPMVTGSIGTPPYCPPGFTGVLPYTEGPAAFRAVFDCNTHYTWPSNANLAAVEDFGITGTITIVDTHGTYTVPLIDDGAMLFDTATQWVMAMNNRHYLDSSYWVIPATSTDLGNLFADLNMTTGDQRMLWRGNFGPFQNLQSFFYWACQRNSDGNSQSPCTGYAPPDGDSVLQWSFNFDSGFQSTSSIKQRYFLMVYYPASTPPLPSCSSTNPCHLEPSAIWSGKNGE